MRRVDLQVAQPGLPCQAGRRQILPQVLCIPQHLPRLLLRNQRMLKDSACKASEAFVDRGGGFSCGSISQRLPEIHGNVAEQSAHLHHFPVSDHINYIIEQARRENSPSELVVITYGSAPAISDTKLMAELKLLDPGEKILRRHFKASRRALNEVGLCAADLVWRALSRQSKELSMEPEPPRSDHHNKPPISGTHTVDQQSKCLQTIKNWNYTMPNLDASSQGFNVTPKLLRLVELLKACQSYGEAFRGIVLRAIAYAIVDMLRSLGEEFPFLRPCVAVRNRAADSQAIFDRYLQFPCSDEVLRRPRRPKASVVIRFDLFHSHVSEAYVRSCARGRESHLIYMVEQDNAAQRRVLSEITQPHPDILRWYNTVSQDPRSTAPPANIYESVDPYLSEKSSTPDGAGSYVCTLCLRTGTKTTASLPAPNGPSRIANVPNTIPDEQSGSGTRTYAQKRPDSGDTVRPLTPRHVISHYCLRRPTRELRILCADALTCQTSTSYTTPFKIFFSGSPATVQFQRAAPLAVNQTKLESLHSYTVRLSRAIGNKPYTCAIEDALFFLAPLDSAQGSLP
ncbi:ribonuclease III [Salix suchowensis]|nr:ribonuclease III [Salix suchowensis]